MPATEIIYTVGYEGRDLQEFIALLKNAGIPTLVDTRLRAHSRKTGFSKTALSATLASSGINYIHRKDLGTPPELMQVLKETGEYEMDEYARHLDMHHGIVEAAAEEFGGKTIALLCYEREANKCHRSVLAQRIAKITKAQVKHL